MDGGSDVIDELYGIFNKIRENQASGKGSENPPLFDKILAGAASTADANSKRLAAQFICRLFRDLTNQQQKLAYNALIDLVEEDDVLTRKQVISGLPKLCRDAATSDDGGSHVSKVADVLVQLLQTDDEQEVSMVQHSLLQVLNCNALEAVDGIFGQINHEDVPEIARMRAIKFLAERLLCVDRAQMTPKVEDAIVTRVDQALEDVSEEEFVCFVRVLASLQCMQTLGGRQRLVDMICAQADFGAPFDPEDVASVAKVRGCARQALPFLSRNIKAEKFVAYFLDKVVPALARVPEEADEGDRPRLDLLKHLAELSGHSGPTFSPTDAQFSNLLACINSEMPLPPEASEGDASRQASAATADGANLNFSVAECLLLTLHNVARARPEYFTERPEELASLRKRLQYFQLANQSYQKSLQSLMDSQKQPGADPAGIQARRIALATTASVGRLILDLFKNPPNYRGGPSDDSTSAPSWRRRSTALEPRPVRPPLPTASPTPGSTTRKRRAVDLPAYRPPAGKFSAQLVGGARLPPAHPGTGGPSATAAFGGRSRYYNVFTSAGATRGAATSTNNRGRERRW